MVNEKLCRERFIEENLGLVHSICKRFIGRGIEYDDLYQAGCVGLVKAYDAFDNERGLMFSTYAVPVIMGEVRRLFRDGGQVKVSRSLKELNMHIKSQAQKLEHTFGREPTLLEIADALNVSKESVAEAICACQSALSLTYSDDDGFKEHLLPVSSPEGEIAQKLDLSKALASLDETDRQIVICRYFKGMTQNAIADMFSLTQVQVSRREKRALKTLKEHLK